MAAIRSMTGAGWARGSTSSGEVTIELRSVNGRGLSIKQRLGPLQSFERDVERRIRARVARGTVQVTISIGGPSSLDAVIDEARFAAAAARLEELAVRHGLADVTIRDVLVVPGVMRAPQESWAAGGSELPDDVAALLDAALDALVQDREAEGGATAAALSAMLDELRALRAEVVTAAPALVSAHRERLLQRVTDFLAQRGVTVDDAAVVREVAMFADKVDVAEELQRLGLHFDRIAGMLRDGGEIGRGLEFLLQETLREVNTIGSKSPDVDIAHTVVAMKSRLDRLKEQAANLE